MMDRPCPALTCERVSMNEQGNLTGRGSEWRQDHLRRVLAVEAGLITTHA